MRIHKKPAHERVIPEPATMEAVGQHVRVNMKGDVAFVAFVRAAPGALGYGFSIYELKEMIDELKEVEKNLES